MMELHHPSCILPSNAPALPEPEAYIPSRALQERSANRLHEYSEDASPRKRSPVYAGRLGGYFTGNLAPHFSVDKSEAQIEIETKRLLKLLKNCDKYQKYRERQPSETASTKPENDKRWPDHAEEAFFRALVRWPPMGRRKLMREGQLRGRNELVAESIMKDTGELRTRKQVSSHIQVLKPMLADQPQILVYMSKEDKSGRDGRSRHARSHYRHRHTSFKYAHSQVDSELQQSLGYLPSPVAHGNVHAGHDESEYTVANFDMFVEAASVRVHTFSQISNSRSRLDDLLVTDTTSWHKQYPEFKFHQTDNFRGVPVIVCDASIKVMTSKLPPQAELSITFDLRSQFDLSVYDSIQCQTRFFDAGILSDQPDGESHTYENYFPQNGVMKVHFGSGFWVQKMRWLGDLLAKASAQEDLAARTRYEEHVRGELQNMTAAQDIYGTRDGEQVCLATVLWRFNQTRTSNEVGRMMWRVASFGPQWVKDEDFEHIQDRVSAPAPVAHTPSSLPFSIPTYTHAIYPSLPLDFAHAYHPPQLDLDTLALEAITGPGADFPHPLSATASSLATEYSQHSHSLPPLSHSQDTVGISQHPLALSQEQARWDDANANANEFDFHGGYITIQGCLEPGINLPSYDAYGTHHHQSTSLALPSPLPHLEDMAMGVSEGAFGDIGPLNGGFAEEACFPTKPWLHAGLISHFESETGGYGGEEGEFWKGGDFGEEGCEDTGVGAEGRRDSKGCGGMEYGRER